MSNKILGLETLAGKMQQLKTDGRKVVMCHGVFDLVHIGHIRHFEQARRRGDILVVTVTPDQFVNKGTHRPAFPERLRAEAVAALEVVDYVAVNRWPTAVNTILCLRPDIYCKGGEYRHVQGDSLIALKAEIDAVANVGGQIEYTDDITFSSSQLINDHFSVFPRDTEEWIKDFRQRHSADEITGYLDATTSLKALVVGEAIIDEYVFCDGLGKSSKDPILAFQYRSTERYAGGSLAVANHLAGFCSEVGITTFLGDSERAEEFVTNALLPGVRPHILTRRKAPTIHKRRFIDMHTGARLFELYLMDDEPLSAADEEIFLEQLSAIAPDYDLIVVTDYGHGMMTPRSIEAVSRDARFLAVNTQVNAGNRGFNTISKYRRADYVCLAGHEVALETRLRHASWPDLLLEVTKRIDCTRFTMTQGKSGSLHYEVKLGFTEVPALATKVIDRVGAGDAALAVTALLVAQHVPWDVVGFVGNLAGAQVVAELGNRVAVNRASIDRHIISILK